MELSLSSNDAAFRQEVRDFIRAELPADIKSKVERGQRLVKEDYVRWQKMLYEKGWIAPGWPLEHGGPGWTPLHSNIQCPAFTGSDSLNTSGGIPTHPGVIMQASVAGDRVYPPEI